MRNTALIAGVTLPTVGTVVYIMAIVRGQVRPQRMTRLLILNYKRFVAWGAHIGA